MDRDKRKAGKIGGARRAEILPPTRRAEIARHAALSRWADKVNAAPSCQIRCVGSSAKNR